MAIRLLRVKDDPILRKVGKKIKVIDERIKELANDMAETMYKENGVGLAAHQVGVLKQICVIRVDDNEPLRVIINPEILEMDGEIIDTEGCLSVPGYTGVVSRPKRVKVKYTNLNSEEVIEEATDLLARAFCHEIDHLQGILYIDKATKMEANSVEDYVDDHEELEALEDGE